MEERRLARARPAGDADEGAVGERERRRREGGDLPAAAAARVTDHDLVELEERPVALVRRHVPPPELQLGRRAGRSGRATPTTTEPAIAAAASADPARVTRWLRWFTRSVRRTAGPDDPNPGEVHRGSRPPHSTVRGGLSTLHRTISKTPSAHLRQEGSANGLLQEGLAMGRRSWIIGSALAVALSLSVSLAADAVTSVTISPSSQTVAAGGTAHWTGSWTGTPPFSGYFQYGDGSANSNFNTSSYSRAFSHSYPYLCVTRVY